MNKRLRIGVVGCGIAGTSFALMARQAGHEVDLYEQTRQVGPVGAGILLQPSGQRILAGMGLLDEVTANAEMIREIHAVTHRGRDLVRLEYACDSLGALAYGLHRGDLFTVLHGALDSAGVRLHLGVAVASSVQAGGRATLIDAAGTARGPFDLVVVADGGKSRVRQSSGIPFRCHEYTHGAMWVVGRCDAVRGKLVQVTRGTHRLCGLLPMGGGRCSLFWGIRRDEYEPLRPSGGWEEWINEVRALAPAAAEVLAQGFLPGGPAYTSFCHVVMSRWFQGRMVFIGDAAHATSPHLGQGVNLALVDAATLARSIEEAADVERALADYSARRRRQLGYYSRVTRLLTPFFQSDGWLLGLGRDIVFPLMQRIPPLRRLMLKTLRGEAYLADSRDLRAGEVVLAAKAG
jgi:2-polyprenyl-6-methoxyphenol hydroxylase-like FAD-dependent oxidoreductase